MLGNEEQSDENVRNVIIKLENKQLKASTSPIEIKKKISNLGR